jgi:hypothetical protein
MQRRGTTADSAAVVSAAVGRAAAKGRHVVEDRKRVARLAHGRAQRR